MSTSHHQPAEHIPLAPLTTIGLGGPARYFVECPSIDAIQEGLAFARHRSLPILVLSGGSNIVARDEGFDGVVLHIALRGRRFERNGSSVIATCAAGEVWDACVVDAIEQGYAGIECLSGIPGSVGATPVQNVGAYGQEVKDSILTVTAFDTQSGAPVSFDAATCGFGYRTSRFKEADGGRFIVTEVVFRLTPNGESTTSYPELLRTLNATDFGSLSPGRTQLQRVRDAVLSLRRKKSMIVDPADPHSRSCGSFFMNPILTEGEFRDLKRAVKAAGIKEQIPGFSAPSGVKVSAAWLVEQAGFRKGFRKGNAGVSDNHALALVNYGCSAKELLDLARDIVEGVQKRFGVRLQQEPVSV